MGANYYAVIPANVRYADINPAAKLLYGEITALATKEGFCWATDRYFADLYGVSQDTVNRWIKELKNINCIHVDTQNTAKGFERKIFIGDVKNIYAQSVATPPSKMSEHSCKNNGAPPSKMSEQENDTSLSITMNSCNNKIQEIQKFFLLATANPRDALLAIGVGEEHTEKVLGDFEAFIEHWSETSIKSNKCKWEMERTFDPRLRFKKWIRNKLTWANEKKTGSRTSEVFTTTL